MTTATTDEPGFLAAVIAEPDRDDLRLIYADWLEENGQADRADLIRVQIELARLRPGPEEHRKASNLLRRYRKRAPVPMRARTPAVLLLRERLLLDTVPAPHPVGACALGWTWRRGFVEEVRLTLDSWLHCGPAFVRATPLRLVTLSDKDPYQTFAAWHGWSDLADDGRNADSPSYLPHCLFEKLADGAITSPVVGWRTRDRALQALSAACIAWALSRPCPSADPSRPLS